MVDQRRAGDDTATRILDVAERLLQQRGYNGFSYADVADELSITKASLHYHFPNKSELGEALIERYSTRFFRSLEGVGARPIDAAAKLDAYAKLYADVLRVDRLCMCGMLAAEYPTLPEAMRGAVIAFFDRNERWVEEVLRQGEREGTLRLGGAPREVARMIVDGLEGAMLVSRSYGNIARFRADARRLFASVLAVDAPELTRSR